MNDFQSLAKWFGEQPDLPIEEQNHPSLNEYPMFRIDKPVVAHDTISIISHSDKLCVWRYFWDGRMHAKHSCTAEIVWGDPMFFDRLRIALQDGGGAAEAAGNSAEDPGVVRVRLHSLLSDAARVRLHSLLTQLEEDTDGGRIPDKETKKRMSSCLRKLEDFDDRQYEQDE